MGSLLARTYHIQNVLLPKGPATRNDIVDDIVDFSSSTMAFNVTVVPVMNGHPRDQAKVSVHDRWPLVAGTGGRRQT